MQRRTFTMGLATAATGFLAGCAERFFFHPDRHVYTTPQQLGVQAQDVRFGGPGLHGWWMPARGPARATVVHAHGNAANITNHAPLVAWMPAAQLNVLTFDYRGFGNSPGSPTLDGLVDDTLAALDHARTLGGPSTPLVLLGQSLGGATSVRAAASERARDLRLLIIDCAFASYRGIARDAAAGGPLSWIAPLAMPSLPPAGRDPVEAMAKVRAPVLVIHGEHDGVIPVSHGERLYAAATGTKQFIRVPGGQHIDALTRADIRSRVLDRIVASL